MAHNSNPCSPDSSSSNQSASQIQDRYIPPSTKFRARRPPAGASASTAQFNPIAIHGANGGPDGDSRSSNVANLVSDADQINSVRLQGTVPFLSPCECSLITIEFKDHLVGDLDSTSDVAHASPSLELQWQFLATSDDKEKETRDTLLTEHAVLVSPLLESRGYSLPSQYALLGRTTTAGDAIQDLRIMLNTNIPFSAFVCGVQGSGKSHTTACMIGMATIPIISLNR